jgi:hypothetical protein
MAQDIKDNSTKRHLDYDRSTPSARPQNAGALRALINTFSYNSVLNVGNGLALLGMTTLIGEFFLTYFAKDKKDIAKKKYDYVVAVKSAAETAAGGGTGNLLPGETAEMERQHQYQERTILGHK